MAMIKFARWGFFNGKLVDISKPVLRMTDRGFLYGDGIFESLRVIDGVVLEDKVHFTRLRLSAKRLGIPAGEFLKNNALLRALDRTLNKNRLRHALLRLSISRGPSPQWGLGLSQSSKPTVTVLAAPFKGHPKSRYAKGLHLMTAPFALAASEGGLAGMKSLNYAANLMACQQAKKNHCDDALFLTAQGFIAEATASNIAWVKGRALHTPALETGILPGITRNRLLRLALRSGLNVKETKARRQVLNSVDEIFLTNTSSWVMPVCRLDGQPVGKGRPGPVAKMLYRAFETHYGHAVMRRLKNRS